MLDDRLKKLREAKGLSMKQTAAELGLPYTTYVNYEKNVNDPGSDVLVKLAVYFGVSVDYLLGYHAPEKTESPPPVHDEREAYRKLLSGLSDEELVELKQFTSYLVWKRKHQDEAES